MRLSVYLEVKMIVYKAENKVNGNCYIGKTAYALKTRKACHLSYARKNKNTYFHKAIRKYGEVNFEWVVLAETDSELKLNVLEKFYIMAYRKMVNVYNLSDGGDGQLGRSPSEATRKKFSELYRGKTISKETKEKISKGNKGKIRTDEFKKNLSEKRKGRIHSEETRKKMSVAQMGNKRALGNVLSEETRKKMSAAQMGNKNACKRK